MWGWPQYTALTLTFLSVVVTGYLHGKERSGEFNVGQAILSAGVWLFILYCGGFFNA